MAKEDRRKRALDISAKEEANYIKTFFEGGENQLEISYDFCHLTNSQFAVKLVK